MRKPNIKTKFYTFGQNNSGGSFDHDPRKGIGYRVCVQAVNADDASNRFYDIIENYSQGGDCSCCGPRWSGYIHESDGSSFPTNYGDESSPLDGGWGIPSYTHYLDGQIVATRKA
jgi:hypothetical protein